MIPGGSSVCLLEYGDHPGKLPEEGVGAGVHAHDACGGQSLWIPHPTTLQTKIVRKK